jgi:hypothetical protein
LVGVFFFFVVCFGLRLLVCYIGYTKLILAYQALLALSGWFLATRNTQDALVGQPSVAATPAIPHSTGDCPAPVGDVRH